MPELPAKGKLLISEPALDGSFFDRSVVLLCEHNDEGSFGLVLNKPSDHSLDQVIEGLTLPDINVALGGPVEPNTMHFLHRKPDLVSGSIQLLENLYWGGNFDDVVNALNIGTLTGEDIRFFAGYSGWSPGQLINEMAQQSWVVTETDDEFVFSREESSMWRTSLREKGGKYKAMANYPTDPRLN